MTYTIPGASDPWEVVVGLEVHAQVISASKLFSGAATTFGAEPNEQVSFVDAAFPGMLPVPNAHCVAQAVRTGLGLKAHINLVSRFDRKNYFYADLPAGYQISQYEKPIVGAGSVEIVLGDFSVRTIGITRLHLEQDAGKSLHDQHSTKSYIDLNRAGVALMEIVSEPDIRSPEEAAHYLQKLRTIMRYLGTCDGNMEEGSLRADVNVSVRRPGEAYRTRCEIKNVNSVRFVMQAIDAEARRQKDIWESGGTVQQETRLFDPASGMTRPMRSKEDAHDYRYFPDPDLPPLVLEEAWVEDLRRTLPELPDAKRARLEAYGLTPYQAAILVSEREVVEHYESAVPDSGGSVELANLYIGPIAAIAKREGLRFEDIFRVSKLAPASTASIAKMIVDQIINRQVAPRVLEITLKTGEDPITIVEARGWRQEKDTAAIDAAVAAVLAANPDKVAEYRAGKEKMFGFFVGQVMREMKGKGNPALVNAALRERLGA